MANMYDAIFNAIDLSASKMMRSIPSDYVGLGRGCEVAERAARRGRRRVFESRAGERAARIAVDRSAAIADV